MSTLSMKFIGMPDPAIFELETFQGKVMDNQESSTTSVTSRESMTDALINSSSSRAVSMPEVKSHTNHRSKVFVRNEKGEEVVGDFNNSDIPVRVGNTVTMVYAHLKGKKDQKQILIGMINNDSKDAGRLTNGNQVRRSFGLNKSMGLLFGCLGGFTIAGMLAFEHAAGGIPGIIVGGIVHQLFVGISVTNAEYKLSNDMDACIKAMA